VTDISGVQTKDILYLKLVPVFMEVSKAPDIEKH
jgi:hypothetical protein